MLMHPPQGWDTKKTSLFFSIKKRFFFMKKKSTKKTIKIFFSFFFHINCKFIIIIFCIIFNFNYGVLNYSLHRTYNRICINFRLYIHFMKVFISNISVLGLLLNEEQNIFLNLKFCISCQMCCLPQQLIIYTTHTHKPRKLFVSQLSI